MDKDDCSYTCIDYIKWSMSNSCAFGQLGCPKSNSPFPRCTFLPDGSLRYKYSGKPAEEIVLEREKRQINGLSTRPIFSE
jgi:hypothetical protein